MEIAIINLRDMLLYLPDRHRRLWQGERLWSGRRQKTVDKKEDYMKLCITSTGKDIDARIDTTFGRAPYFIVINTATNALEVVENSATTQGHGAGITAAQLLSDKGVDGVLTGHVGPNAFNAFRASGMKLFVGASSQDTVKEALAKFNNGEYNEAPAPQEVPPCGPDKGRGAGGGMGRGRGRCQQDQ